MEAITINWNNLLLDVKGFIFDLDGCIYSGNKLNDGAKEIIALLEERQIPFCFLTNNSTDSAEQIRLKLKNKGLIVHSAPIITMTEITGKYIYEQFGASKLYVLGSEVLHHSLKEYHHVIDPEKDEHCDFVVISRDEAFSYTKLTIAVNLIRKGAKLIATNLDSHHPDAFGGWVPETGSLAKAVQEITKEIPVVIGKPYPYSIKQALSSLGVKANETMIVGDNLDTDILGGINLHMKTCWINWEGIPCHNELKPTITVHSLKQLYENMKEVMV